MQCSSVGIEIWFFAIVSAVSLYLLTFGARPFQRWLRAHRPRSVGLRLIPAVFLDESTLWSMRALSVIPAVMVLGAMLGVFCFFHGPG